MPLDTGPITHNVSLSVGADRDELLSVQPPSLDFGISLGDAFRAVREFHGRDLEDLAHATRIRRHYLAAIEDMAMEQLPSRPFTIGYVRSYAQALGLEADAAVARFKSEFPDEDEPLRAPVGVRREGDPRLGMIALLGTVVVGAVVLWNVAQRAIATDAPASPTTAAAASASVAPRAVSATPSIVPTTGPVTLGAPLPAPPESTVPKPYVTPGLPQVESASASAASSQAVAEAAAIETPPTVFVPHGAVFGAATDAMAVTIQAKRAALVVIHGADGAVYFARQLTAGEAYRAPAIKGLTVDLSDPEAFDVFIGGAFKGPPPGAQFAISKLIG